MVGAAAAGAAGGAPYPQGSPSIEDVPPAAQRPEPAAAHILCAWIWSRHNPFKTTQRAVLQAICGRMWKGHDFSFPSIATIATEAGCNVRTVTNALQVLRDHPDCPVTWEQEKPPGRPHATWMVNVYRLRPGWQELYMPAFDEKHSRRARDA